MDSLLKNEQEQLQNLPMIIAMKGLSSSSQKREIASKLAKFIPYPLIDEEDVLSNLENFLESSSTNFTTSINELSFKILTQITSKQLQLKLPVILITSFSQSNHLDHLLQLASSNDASLIIIECEAEINHQAHGIEHVPKISIDTTKPFEVEKFVPMILNAAKLYKDRDNLHVLEGKQSEEPCNDTKDIFPERRRTLAHAHEFFFIEEPKNIIDSNKLHCNYCNELISGPTYKCTECNEFILHKFCAELPNKLEFLPENCPSFLTENPPTYDFPETHKCNACEQFSSNCNDCLLQTYIKIGRLPTAFNYEKHVHPLSFVTMPLWFNYVYKCVACDKLGKSISYKCYNCNYDLHINCAFMRKEESAAQVSKELVFLGVSPRTFVLEDLLRASAEVLGRGTFGTTYKASLEMGMAVAVKRLRNVTVSEKEFREKIESVGKLKHENLVPLMAYYCSKDEKLLVYDYMPMGSLSAYLHGSRGAGRTPLNWVTRLGIALGSARAIAYLHSQGQPNCHGNIKSSNILLTKSFEARVSDCGLALLAGPISPLNSIDGYKAPEVTDASKVWQKADVYSFGTLILQLLTGKFHVRSLGNNEEIFELPRWVQTFVKNERTAEVFDVQLLPDMNAEEEMVQLLMVALSCTAQDPDSRPSMAEVRSMIEDISHSSSHEQHNLDVKDDKKQSRQTFSVDSGAPIICK